MQDSRDERQERFRTAGIKDGMDAGRDVRQEGCMTADTQDKRDSGQEGSSIGNI